MPEFFSPVEVGKVDLDGGDGDRGNGIAERHAGVGQAPGIDDKTDGRAVGLLDAIDEKSLMVGLKSLYGDSQLGAMGFEVVVDLAQGVLAIDVGFAGAKEVQIRAMDNHDHRMIRCMR
jgi:hypothetical protein